MRRSEERAIVGAFSRGEISRPEAGRRLGRDLDFADMLVLLRKHRLPLPRPPVDPNSPGVRLIQEAAERAAP